MSVWILPQRIREIPQTRIGRTFCLQLAGIENWLADSGRHWCCTSDGRILQWRSVAALYFKKYRVAQDLNILLMTQVDINLYCGLHQMMRLFKAFLHNEFDIVEEDQHYFIARGYWIDQNPDRSVIFPWSTWTGNLDTACLWAHRPNKGDIQASLADIQTFREIMGPRLYLSWTESQNPPTSCTRIGNYIVRPLNASSENTAINTISYLNNRTNCVIQLKQRKKMHIRMLL